MAESMANSYSMDPTLWLYTSLTSGSSHIITATSRMETILRANRIPFKALDLATDEKARMLWGRRAGKDSSGRQRKIPGLVQMGIVIGDIVEVEDWNEYGELKQHIKIVPVPGAPVHPIAKLTNPNTVNKSMTGCESNNLESCDPRSTNDIKTQETGNNDYDINEHSQKGAEIPGSDLLPISDVSPVSMVLRQLGEEAAQKAKENKGLKKSQETVFNGVGKAEPRKQDISIIDTPKTEKIEISYTTESEKEQESFKKNEQPEKENQLLKKVEPPKDQNYAELKKEHQSIPKQIKPEIRKKSVGSMSLENADSVNITETGREESDSCSKLTEELTNKEVELNKTKQSISEKGSEKKPVKETLKRPAVILPPDSLCIQEIFSSTTNNFSSFQSPNSSAWKNSIIQFASLQPPSDRVESIQSPNSTAWKPASLDQTLSEVVFAEKASKNRYTKY